MGGTHLNLVGVVLKKQHKRDVGGGNEKERATTAPNNAK